MTKAELHKCTAAQFETFRAELNEFDDEKINENEKKIHDWYSTQPHLPQNYGEPVLPLPSLTRDGYRITYFDTPKDKDLDLPSLYKSIMMICDIRTVEEDTLRGDVFIFNSENVTAKVLSKIVSPLTKKALTAAQVSYY
ncbi:hypothetical protein WDU94_010318 [Cyamophila willieti]